jgi:hypothetical protein
VRLPELVELEKDRNKARSRRKPQPLHSKPVTVGDLIREGKLLEVHCSSCRPARHLYIAVGSLDLPKRMPVPEVADHLVCSLCGAKNSDPYHPICQAGCQSARGDRPISGLQQTLMTIFSAVMSINDRPPCIRYTGPALLGAGRRPWEISRLPGHLKTGRLPAATLPPRLRHGLTEAPSSISSLRHFRKSWREPQAKSEPIPGLKGIGVPGESAHPWSKSRKGALLVL